MFNDYIRFFLIKYIRSLLPVRTINIYISSLPYPMPNKKCFVKGLVIIFTILMCASGYAQSSSKQQARMVARVDSLNNQAQVLLAQDAGEAFILLTQAELLAAEYRYTKGLAVAYLNEAEVLSQRGYSKRALELYYRSLQLSKSSNDVYNVARAEEHISTIKRRSGGLRDAEKLLYRSLDIFKKLNKPIDVVNIQLRLGLLKADQQKYNEAKRCFDEAYMLSKESGYTYGEKKSYYNRALLYKILGKPDSAIYFLYKSLSIDSTTGDEYGKALSYLELSRIYINGRNYGKASFYAKQAYNKADSIAALAVVKTAVQLLLYISKQSADKDAIIKWQDELIDVDNTITERERKESVNFIDALRMQEEQQIKIQQNVIAAKKKSEQQKLLIVLYTGFLLVFIIIMLTLGYNYKKAKKYTAQLNVKNKQIEQNMALLDKLNSEVISQNQKLEDDNQLKSKLLSIISHDLRKPLTSTKSLVHLVKTGLISEEETKDLFGHLETQYIRVLALTDNLLFWIRGQVNGTPTELIPVNMYHLIGSVIEEQEIPLSDKGITVNNNLPRHLQWLTDMETIRIVIRNLLNNAVKFTPVKGIIEFSAQADGQQTSVTITDNGVGMSPEVMEGINSETYYTTKGTQNEEGSGFGLMLIRDLIKKFNGKLHMESALGKGSSFTISFPASTALLPETSL